MASVASSHSLKVQRTARVEVAGDVRAACEVAIVIHGYAQTAAEMLSACAPLEREGRVLVAPEALSRFYRRGSSGPIGASWMTREARADEIADYVAYLDQLAGWCASELGVAAPPAVLGFSQGAATAWRWAALGGARLSRLVAFGGGIPPDLDLAAARARLAGVRIGFGRGRSDSYHTAEWLERDRARLAELGLGCEAVEFDGGHELAPAALAALVAAP